MEIRQSVIFVMSLCLTNQTTKSMWDHLKAKHSLEMIGDKQSVKQKFGPVMKQSKLDMSFSQKFSKEKHETCYKASAEVCLNTSISETPSDKDEDEDPPLPELY